MKKLLLTLLMLFASTAFAEKNENNSIAINDNLTIASKTLQEENKNEHYKIIANYPQIEGEPLPPAAIRFNELVAKLAKAEMDKFKRYMKINAPNLQFIPESTQSNELYVAYKAELIRANKQTLISINLSTEGMTAGAAHPYHTTQTLNYDFTTSKVVTLKDLFKPRSNYLNLISKYAINKLEPDMHDKKWLAQGAGPQEKNYKNWNLQADGILFTFNEYQIQAYSYGQPTVKIPYTKLKSIISSTSTIHACVKDTNNCEAITKT